MSEVTKSVMENMSFFFWGERATEEKNHIGHEYFKTEKCAPLFRSVTSYI